MLPSFLIPLALVLAAALLLPRGWMEGAKAKPWVLLLTICGVAIVVLRYLSWRITETLPADGVGTSEAMFSWALFTVESLVWIDTAILFLMISRPRNNTAAADRGEARLRAQRDDELPSVDVFIATYNEDFDVIEKTIHGAQVLDWPADRLRICVLDDGKRDWLRDYCAKRGVDYFTRETNEHAKAGNINAAIARTDGEYFLVLDADFIPQENFLYRAMGLFEDPKVGIVQIPHSFYNPDPMQANLKLRKVLPDDQRFFFGTVMAGRDGWNTAFCCGSNSITRRSAMKSIGNRLPTGSITEDMLLTLALLRKGYVTRYLNERLAIGLAPESLSAMYIQRARWARGAVQILFLREGPFGPGLKWHERLMFIPLHWLAQPLVVVTTLLTPAICLWTSWSPLGDATTSEVMIYQAPALVAVVAALRLIAPNGFFPLATMVHTCIQAPRILPTVISTLFRPHGHAFKVTPKGQAAGGVLLDRVMIYAPAALIVVTAMGIHLNADINTRILASSAQLPLLVIWAIFSMLVLSVVQAVAVTPRAAPKDDLFPAGDLSCVLVMSPEESMPASIDRLSMTSARLKVGEASDRIEDNSWVRLDIPDIGHTPALLRRHGESRIEAIFDEPQGDMRERLLRFLYTQGRDNSPEKMSAQRIASAMLMRTLGWRMSRSDSCLPAPRMPDWLRGAARS